MLSLFYDYSAEFAYSDFVAQYLKTNKQTIIYTR